MKNILLLLAITFSLGVNAQISQGGEPVNWSEKDLDRIEVSFLEFEALNMPLIQAQDEISDQHKDTPYRFGIEKDVDLNLSNSGEWTTLDNGTRIWRQGFHCPEATSISFHLNEFRLEKGAQLFIWNEDRSEFLGAFTHLTNKSHGELPISFLNDDKVVMEYVLPAAVSEGQLSISMVVHGYRGLANKFDADRGPYGNSGACNINVNCPEGDEWQVEKKSVALILQGGNAVCTGSLVNNTANDGTPYFLTADHCLGNPQNWTYLFNHESEDCNGNNGPTLNTVASGDLRANNSGSDFALIELSNVPPESYGVEYAGWDKSDVENVSACTGIHHPSGDVKKICHDTDAPYHANQGGAAVWYIDEWEDGVTEPGSSGSALFDQNHRIIGQLYGGFAACNGNVNNGQADWYGRFGVSWDGASASVRLKDWLDPQNLDPQVWDGWPTGAVSYEFDAGIIMETEINGSQCGDNLYPGILIVNSGLQNLTEVTFTVTLNEVVTQTETWTGNLAQYESEFIALDYQPIVDGQNDLIVDIISIGGMEDENDLNNSAILDFNAVTNPLWYQMNLVLDQYGSETRWDVKNENNFIVAEGGPYEDGTDGMEIVEEFCISDGCYDLTVYDSFGDGMCCGFGDGEYFLDNQANVVVAAGGEFGDSETQEFCASANSIAENSATNLILYPNPASETMFVELNAGDSELKILDLTGREIMKNGSLSEGIMEIGISSLASGTYLISIVRNDQNIIQRFIKE